MFRALITLITLIVLMASGCGSIRDIGLSAWNETSTVCPDSGYDNGGSVEPGLGYCKLGRGFFLSYETKIN